MKFGIRIKSDQLESMERLVGMACDGIHFKMLLKSGEQMQAYNYLCCTGSFGAYSKAKKFFGKNQVGKWNW